MSRLAQAPERPFLLTFEEGNSPRRVAGAPPRHRDPHNGEPMPSTRTATPFVSAVICTRNRPDKIGNAVASVLACDYPSFELVVIDQSSTDATQAVLAPITRSDSRLRYFHVDEAGLSRAYNSAIRRTDGEIIAFTDDDCIVPATWLRAIVDAFTADDEGDLLYGRVVPASGEQL